MSVVLDESTILKNLEVALSTVKATSDFLAVKSQFLGKDSQVSILSSKMRDLSPEEKKEFGSRLNNFRKKIEELLAQKQIEIENAEELENQGDLSMPAVGFSLGATHPIIRTIRKLENIFSKAGFHIIDGPEIEEDFYNFTALNIPSNHPARDSHDTFYLQDNLLLRTHTSNVQIRTLEKNKQFPLNLVSTGKVYRKDYDNTHTPMFHQMEGLCIGKDVNMGNLIFTLQGFLKELFQSDIKMRVRPSYFPFTEPSIEIDIGCIFCEHGCSYCKGSKYIEILGAGMVHPNVLRNLGLNPEEVSGFAFGLGIERVCSLLYKINDIRKFYEGSFDFIKQF